MNIVLVDSGGTLAPLTDRLPKTLLPICGKSLSVLWLELLCNAKITEVTIVTKQQPVFEKKLGSGSRWGVQLHYAEEIEKILDACLVFDMEQLCDVDISEVLKAANEKEEVTCVQIAKQAPMGVFVPENIVGVKSGAFPLLVKQATDIITIEGQCVTVDSFMSFYQVNLDLLQGMYRYVAPAGRLVSERLYLNNMSTYKNDSLCSGFLYLGERCNLHKSVVVQSNVVIGDHVIVDKEAKIIHSVILPDTYVGRFTEVTNALVWGNVLIKVETDTVVEIDDDFILGNLKQEKPADGLGKIRKWLSR